VEPVYLHLDLDDYEPCFMPKNPETGEYEIIRAVPNKNEAKFFISHRGRPKLSKNYDIV
jgi:hypothetical protein